MSRRFVEGDFGFFFDLSKTVGNGKLPLVSEQKLKAKADPMLIDNFTTKPMDRDSWQISKHLFPIDWKSMSNVLEPITGTKVESGVC